MRFRIPPVSFRARVVLLAVLLVAIQLGAVFPLLGSIRGEQTAQAEAQAVLAGATFAQYMQNRATQLTELTELLSKEWTLRQAIGSADYREIELVLDNLAGRGEFGDAAVFDISGRYVGGLGVGRALANSDAHAHFAGDPSTEAPFHAVVLDGEQLFETISVPIRETITSNEAYAWLTTGFPIDDELASDVANLTGHETTFLRFRIGGSDLFATSLDETGQGPAAVGLHLGSGSGEGEPIWGEQFVSLLHPAFAGNDRFFVALQQPVADAMRSYFTLRNFFVAVTGIAMLATILAALWFSRMVTAPVGRLVDAARRMADGIYNRPIDIDSNDEFGVLAQGFNAMQKAIASREQHIVHMAHHDSLSGLPTREIVVGEIRDATARCEQLAIINFVLHRFDELAASLGHRTADRLIQAVAERLRSVVEQGQILGHLNHQEFVLVIPGASLAVAEDHVVELQNLLRSGFAVEGANLSLQARAGIAMYPVHGVNASELLRCAGIARSQASHHLGSVGIYEPGQERKALQLIRIVGDFPRALQNRELRLEFQPKVAAESLKLDGAEALVRWQHPELGELLPDLFIEAIEQAGGISQLTRWVLEEAAATLQAWRRQGITMPISVNISTHDLIDDYLPAFLTSLFDRHGLRPDLLTLEVTESAIMRDVEHSLSVINTIRELGCRVAIDDFGTGHSSLAHIRHLTVDELKVDKSFVRNIADRRDEAVVRAAIELAHTFGLQAVAEGVEDEESLLRLKQLGCETVQGYFIARPMRAADFVRWTRSWERGSGADIVTLVDPGHRARGA